MNQHQNLQQKQRQNEHQNQQEKQHQLNTENLKLKLQQEFMNEIIADEKGEIF